MHPDHPSQRPFIVIIGQTPPPWHGQAVATQLLFDHDWPGHEVCRLRMAFSSEMEEVGRFHFRKLFHAIELWRKVRKMTNGRGNGILIYPPASPNWVPVLRDLLILPRIRRRFNKVVFIYHAGGVGAWFAASRFRRWIGRIAYGRADLCLEVARDQPAPHEVLRARSWAWTPYGVAVPQLPTRPARNAKQTKILFVGSLQEGKGVLEILKTASLLKERGMEHDFRFHLVGRWFSNEFKAEVTRMRDEMELTDMVVLVGQLTGDAKWNAYLEADVFFFPTHYESEAFPLVLIEALACGLPVVTTRWRGIPDLVAGCKTASLCDVRSPESYAEALLHWRSLGAASWITEEARRYYELNYRPEQFLSQIGKLIGQLSDPPRLAAAADHSNSHLSDSRASHASRPLHLISIYLADQNPKLGRSLGISRMTEVVLEEMHARGTMDLRAVASASSIRGPDGMRRRELPWGTRHAMTRVLTDHLHPLLQLGEEPDVWYFPKGFLPTLHTLCSPSVVTIHDTIVQYYADHFPEWRTNYEYRYWAGMLKQTLRNAGHILTVSHSAKSQIEAFMERHHLPAKEITVTYEPCLYETVPQPVDPPKGGYLLHLASREPHKRTAWLVRHWLAPENADLPPLHVVGSLPKEVREVVAGTKRINALPFLDDDALQAQFLGARGLVFPSEIEGFGLPAIEAYYLGTPVCFVKGTSVEEVLEVATHTGGFHLGQPESLNQAIHAVLALPATEIHRCGLVLRQTYAATKVVDRMEQAFAVAAGRVRSEK